MNKKSIKSTILGILAIIIMFIPIVNITVTFLAIYFAIKGLKQGKKEQCKGSIALAIIGFSLGSLTMMKHIYIYTQLSLKLTTLF